MPPTPRLTPAQKRIEAAIDTELAKLRETRAKQKGLLTDVKKAMTQLQKTLSNLQNAENVRSQAEKRLEQQRKDLTRNWGG